MSNIEKLFQIWLEHAALAQQEKIRIRSAAIEKLERSGFELLNKHNYPVGSLRTIKIHNDGGFHGILELEEKKIFALRNWDRKHLEKAKVGTCATFYVADVFFMGHPNTALRMRLLEGGKL